LVITFYSAYFTWMEMFRSTNSRLKIFSGGDVYSG
jgi:hypothetical protein